MFLCVFEQIREELRANGIDVYPQKEFDEDAEDRMINEKIRVSGSCYNRSITCLAGVVTQSSSFMLRQACPQGYVILNPFRVIYNILYLNDV